MNENIILLSIIVPIYNVEKYLRQCIDSILAQTFTDFEVILVNDGSTDSSLEICEEYQKKDNRVRVINKSNGGLISAKKAGLQHAVGKYVGFVDGDDWIDNVMYEKMYEAVAETGADIIVCDNIVDYPNQSIVVKQGIEYGVYEKEDLISYVYPNLAFAKEIYKLGVSPSLCTKIFKKNLIEPYQAAVNEMIKGGEDAACTYPCMLKANVVAYIEGGCGYHYRVHNQSMTHKKRELDIAERMILLTHLGEAFGKYDYPGLERQYGLYSAAVLEELVLNFFAYRRNREAQKVQELLRQVKNNIAWEKVMKLYLGKQYPKQTNHVVAYLNEPTWINERRVALRVRIISLKSFVKGVLIKIGGRKN